MPNNSFEHWTELEIKFEIMQTQMSKQKQIGNVTKDVKINFYKRSLIHLKLFLDSYLKFLRKKTLFSPCKA